MTLCGSRRGSTQSHLEPDKGIHSNERRGVQSAAALGVGESLQGYENHSCRSSCGRSGSGFERRKEGRIGLRPEESAEQAIVNKTVD